MTAQWPSFPLGLPTGGRDTRCHNRELLCDITLALLGSTWWVSVAHQTTLQGAPTSLSFLLLFLLLLFLPVILCNRWHSWRLVHGKDTVENKTKNCTFLEGREKKLLSSWIINTGPCPIVIMRSGTGEKQMAWWAWRAERSQRRRQGLQTMLEQIAVQMSFHKLQMKMSFCLSCLFVMGMILLIKFYYWNTRNLEPVTSQVALSLEGYLLIQHILLKVLCLNVGLNEKHLEPSLWICESISVTFLFSF